MSSSLNGPAREPALDAVRGLAIMSVTIFRFGTRHREDGETAEWLAWVCGKGERGVDLFFVLSGFLITGILFDAKGHRHAFRNFMARRALRIFPLYFGVLLAFLVVVPRLFPLQSLVNQHAIDHQAWLWPYGTNILVSVEDQWNLGVFNHFWSLAVEEHFYLLWPAAVLLLSRRSAMNLCLALVVIAAATRIFVGMVVGNHVAAEAFTVCRMDALAIGGWVALAARSPGGVGSLVPLAWRLALPSFGIILVIALARKGGWYVPHTLTAVACAGLIIWALRGTDPISRRLWGSPFLRLLGKFSYAMYVFQTMLVVLADSLWPPSLLGEYVGPLAGRVAYVALSFAVVFLVAFVSWHAYEKHFLKLKRFFADAPSENTLETTTGRS